MKSSCEIVYLESGTTQRSAMGPIAATIMTDAGRTTPIIAIVSPDQTVGYGGASCHEMKDSSVFSSLKSKVKSKEDATPQGNLYWFMDNGRFYHGAYVKSDATSFTIKRSDSGKNQKIQYAAISKAAADYAKELALGEYNKSKPEVPEFIQESWAPADSSKRAIKATFLRMDGDKIGLKLVNGRTAFVPKDKFSQDSQDQAAENQKEYDEYSKKLAEWERNKPIK